MAGDHDLTTEQGLQAYLAVKNEESPSSVQLLTGGTANYVYRVTWPNSPTRIYKHAAPYLHSNKNFAFDQARMDFEAYILNRASTLQNQPSLSDHIHAAQLFDYDRQNKLLCIEDGGERNLKDIYTEPWLDVFEVAKYVAKWLATLHIRSTNTKLAPEGDTTGNNHIGVAIYRHSYSNLHTALSKYGHDISIAERINEQFGSLLATDDECVCHGDFWPGNVLVRRNKLGDSNLQSSSDDSGTKPHVTLTIVDWEMVRRGTSATDVGQFAAEAFLLDRFRGGKGLLKPFLSCYIANREQENSALRPGREWLRRMAVHWAVHVAFWPTRVPWTDEAGTKKLVHIGVNVLQCALASDWEGLQASPLFEGLEGELQGAFSRD